MLSIELDAGGRKLISDPALPEGVPAFWGRHDVAVGREVTRPPYDGVDLREHWRRTGRAREPGVFYAAPCTSELLPP